MTAPAKRVHPAAACTADPLLVSEGGPGDLDWAEQGALQTAPPSLAAVMTGPFAGDPGSSSPSAGGSGICPAERPPRQAGRSRIFKFWVWVSQLPLGQNRKGNFIRTHLLVPIDTYRVQRIAPPCSH